MLPGEKFSPAAIYCSGATTARFPNEKNNSTALETAD
jgi:hypothetical protein